ncbi:MAG: hypothetical protein DMF75_11285 [Acidobacteria bacterium]|nr:MAG: hypothetical protein DMF75_11285 [Acidobacteriota bacterium]
MLQNFAGSNKSPDWSPDGKSLAYVVEHGSRAGEFGLAIRSLETDQVQELRPPLGRVDWLRWKTLGHARASGRPSNRDSRAATATSG